MSLLANTPSARKRVRQTATRTLRNRIYKSRIRTMTRRFREALSEGDLQKAKEFLARVASIVDKAAKKGVIHPNFAARRKSRLQRRLNEVARSNDQLSA